MNTYATLVKFFQDSGVFIYPSILVLALACRFAIRAVYPISVARAATNRKMWG